MQFVRIMISHYKSYGNKPENILERDKGPSIAL